MRDEDRVPSKFAARRRNCNLMTATRPSFYILDAFNLIFQVFHAIPRNDRPGGAADAGGLRNLIATC